VSIAAISEVVQTMFGGVVVGKFAKGGHRYDIRLKLTESRLKNDDDFEKRFRGLYVRNNRGELIELIKLVDLKNTKALQNINRVDRQRAITVYANVASGHSQSEVLQESEKLAKHIAKNKQDKKTGRSFIITNAKLKKIKEYLGEK
jgi:HAE1 family hydrophobic/amphiphilic exporter-1